MTPVIFRNEGTPITPEIVAVFPTIPHDKRGVYATTYSHADQHSSATYDWYLQKTKPARPSEYADLLAELEAVGYENLKIYNQWLASFDAERIREATT